MNQRFQLIVIGAGPCGIAAGAAAKKAGVSCVLFDKGCVTSSLMGYPYYMTFFSTAVMLEVGGVPFTIPNSKPTRREALAYYRRVVEHWDIDVRQYQKVEAIHGGEGDFTLETRKADGTEETYHAAAVVVATGSFDRPNLLGVPGEDLDRVHHYYREPYAYHDQDVLVVGAGNSAVESALDMYRNGARVTIVHFLDKIDDDPFNPDLRNRGGVPEFQLFVPIRDTRQGSGVTTYPIVVDIIEPTAPNFQAILDETHFVLYSVGPDGKKDWAKNIREDVSEVFEGDYLIWPPTIALYRQHMREIGQLE